MHYDKVKRKKNHYSFFSLSAVDYGVEILDHQSGWLVTDLAGNIQVPPYWSSVTSGLTIAQVQVMLVTLKVNPIVVPQVDLL